MWVALGLIFHNAVARTSEHIPLQNSVDDDWYMGFLVTCLCGCLVIASACLVDNNHLSDHVYVLSSSLCSSLGKAQRGPRWGVLPWRFSCGFMLSYLCIGKIYSAAYNELRYDLRTVSENAALFCKERETSNHSG